MNLILCMLASYIKMYDALATTQGTNAKLDMMREHKELYPIFEFLARKPKTGLSEEKLTTYIDGSNSTETTTLGLMEMLEALEKKEITGNEAKLTVRKFINANGGEKVKKYVIGLASVDPHLGIATAGFAKIVPVKKWLVQLAETWDEKKHAELMSQYPAFISEKKDGMRLIAAIDADKKTVDFYSRSGKKITSLESLKVPLLSMYKSSLFIDGELFSSSEETWAKTVSEVRRKNNQVKAPRFYQFDALTHDEFFGLDTKHTIYSERYKRLVSIDEKKINNDTPAVITLPQYPYSPHNFDMLCKAAEKKKWEGLIIRCDVPYAGKRSAFLMKWKVFEDAEFKVKDVVIENFDFPNGNGGYTTEPALNSVVIEYKGHPTNVGGGFTHEERKQYAKNNGADIIGKMISVKYKQETVDSKTGFASLQFPVFKGFIGKERDF